jgi:glutamate-1-semialdehyde 2,1-aminomutase
LGRFGERAGGTRRRTSPEAAYGYAGHLFGRVPMTWMNKDRRRPFARLPLYLAARAAPRSGTSNGHDYTDFRLGDPDAMTRHSPAAVYRRR